MKTLNFLCFVLTTVSGHLTKINRTPLATKGDPHIRPNKITAVEMSFVLTAFNKLDSLKQELGTTFHLYLTWIDPRLSWTPSSTLPESIVFYVNEIWTPPLVVSNAVKDSMFLLRDDIYPMRVDHTGTVTWIPRVSPTTTCEVDTSIFPVDIQVCDISITSWVHSTDELVLVKGNTSHYPDPVNLDFYTADKAWELIKTSVEVVNLTGGYDLTYQQINYRFHFRRHERFYWVLLVIPGICLAFLQPLVFLIPLNAQGDRLSYATTMLLSFLFYTGVITSILPPIFSSENNHIFGESFGVMMILSTTITVLVIIEMMATIILKQQHAEDEKGNGLWCLAGLKWKECTKCYVLQIVNFVIFAFFLFMYIGLIAEFLISLSKEDTLVNLY